MIEVGIKANPPLTIDLESPKSEGCPRQSPPQSLLNRLQKHQLAVLTFMNDFRVPFNNNQAERDLRMMKLKQKISDTFRLTKSTQEFCRIQVYLSTLRKQGIQELDALRLVFMETPILPAL